MMRHVDAYSRQASIRLAACSRAQHGKSTNNRKLRTNANRPRKSPFTATSTTTAIVMRSEPAIATTSSIAATANAATATSASNETTNKIDTAQKHVASAAAAGNFVVNAGR